MAYPKVKITREQEKAAKDYKENRLVKGDKNLLEMFCNLRHSWDDVYKPIANFDVPEFALILAGHYEVIPEFKVGDWVYHIKHDRYMKIEPENAETSTCKFISLRFVNENPERFRKVENSLEIALLELGRKRPIFLAGDIILTADGDSYVVERDSDPSDYINVMAVYPAATRIRV
jgi:hypothetical protein